MQGLTDYIGDLEDSGSSIPLPGEKAITSHTQPCPAIPTSLSDVPKGWLCPRCNRINAPYVSKCACTESTLPPRIDMSDINRSVDKAVFDKKPFFGR